MSGLVLFVAETVITPETGVNVGILIAIVAAIWKFSGMHNRMMTKVESAAEKIVNLEKNQYTMPQAEANAMRMAMDNPGLRVPDPRNPSKFFCVREHRDERQRSEPITERVGG